MKMANLKTLAVAVFVLTLGAGVMAGLLAARLPASNVSARTPSESALAAELDLSAAQGTQIRGIWEQVRDLARQSLESAQKAERERDDAISALVPPEKRAELNDIRRRYQEQTAALIGRRQAAFDKAVQDTKAILSETQREKYDRLLKKRLGDESNGAHDPVSGQTPSAVSGRDGAS